MADTLIPKQFDIIKLLYRFRFLTSSQIQQFIHDKTPRLTNYHLKILTDQKYISKHYTRTLGSANRPAVYFLAPGSFTILRDQADIPESKLKRIYRERLRSQQFIDHCIFMADYCLKLRTDSSHSNQTLHFFTKSDLESHPYIIKPLPDAYFARVDAEGNTKRYFVEVVDEGSPRFAIRKRFERYSDYVEAGTFEEATSHPFPTILCICPSVGLLIYLKKYLGRIIEETSLSDISIYLATEEGAFSGHWEQVVAEDE